MTENITVVVPKIGAERIDEIALIAVDIVGISDRGAIGISVIDTRDLATGFLALLRFAQTYGQLQQNIGTAHAAKNNDDAFHQAMNARGIISDDLAAQIELLLTKEAN